MRLAAVLLSALFMAAMACARPEAPAPPSQDAPAGPAAAAGGAGGGAVRLWQDAAIFESASALLAASPPQVLVEMYEFDRPDLVAALLAAHARGAEVRLLVDRTVAASAGTADRLTAAGLAVRAYPVDDRRRQIDHVKLLLAGGSALVGGMNWGRHSAANHDYALETAAPAMVTRLRSIFEQDWALAGGRPQPLPEAAAGGVVVQTAPHQEVRRMLAGAIGQARRSVAAEVFTLTDAQTEALLGAARRRGVRVRVLLDPGQEVNRDGYRLLREAGGAGPLVSSPAWGQAARQGGTLRRPRPGPRFGQLEPGRPFLQPRARPGGWPTLARRRPSAPGSSATGRVRASPRWRWLVPDAKRPQEGPGPRRAFGPGLLPPCG